MTDTLRHIQLVYTPSGIWLQIRLCGNYPTFFLLHSVIKEGDDYQYLVGVRFQMPEDVC